MIDLSEFTFNKKYIKWNCKLKLQLSLLPNFVLKEMTKFNYKLNCSLKAFTSVSTNVCRAIAQLEYASPSRIKVTTCLGANGRVGCVITHLFTIYNKSMGQPYITIPYYDN